MQGTIEAMLIYFSVVDISRNRLEDPKVHGIFSGMKKLVRVTKLSPKLN